MNKKKKALVAAHRYLLFVEYDGTRYSGWQKQDDARTIQGELLHAADQACGGPVDIQGCGRTDSGVHALEYVAHLETTADLDPGRLVMAINDHLPADINVLAAERSHPRLHARHHCVGRSYLYRISKRRTAFGKKYVWWVKDRLDTAAMRQAAGLFVGMHDFISFADKQELKKSTKVLLDSVQVTEDAETISIRVAGSHFLWKMVRRMVGVLVEVGRHNLTAAQVHDMLLEPSDRPARLTAPPAGLFFEKAFFNDESWRSFIDSCAGKNT